MNVYLVCCALQTSENTQVSTIYSVQQVWL